MWTILESQTDRQQDWTSECCQTSACFQPKTHTQSHTHSGEKRRQLWQEGVFRNQAWRVDRLWPTSCRTHRRPLLINVGLVETNFQMLLQCAWCCYTFTILKHFSFSRWSFKCISVQLTSIATKLPPSSWSWEFLLDGNSASCSSLKPTQTTNHLLRFRGDSFQSSAQLFIHSVETAAQKATTCFSLTRCEALLYTAPMWPSSKQCSMQHKTAMLPGNCFICVELC